MTNETIRAMNAEDDGTVRGYMCAVDWECEIWAAHDGNKVYPSIEALKHHHDCWEDCGIVEVRVSFAKLAVRGKMEARIDAFRDAPTTPSSPPAPSEQQSL